MKNLIFKLITVFVILVLVILSPKIKGQNKAISKLKIDYFVSLKYSFFNDFNINGKFKNSGLPYLDNDFIGISGGYDLVYEKLLLSAEMGIFSNSKKFQNNQKSFVKGFNASFILSRQIFSFGNDMVYAGVGYDYSSYSAFFYLDNNEIDISNISPTNFQGVLNLYNSSNSIKPCIMMKLKNKSGDVFGNMRIAYSINLSQSDWKSSNSEIKNPVNESFNHFEISYLFYFKRKK